MGLIDFISKFKLKRQNKTYAQMLNGFSPVFNMFGNDIFASDVVQQAISCITQEMSKLSPQHLLKGVPQNSQIQKVLTQPNEHMSQSDFLEKLYWELLMKYNVFVIPTYDRTYDKVGNEIKTLTGLYPISPIQTELLEDGSGRLFVTFKFYNNYETTLRYEDVIHIKYRFSVNEYMGGNEIGQPDHEALLKTLELNETMLDGVSKAMRSSYSINGVVKYNVLIDQQKMEPNIKLLEEQLRNGDSGLLGLDLKGEFIPFKKDIKFVDEATLKFIDEKILRHFGVPLSILTGNFTKAEYEAFYQKTLEPLIKRTAETFTMSLFTDREKSFGNKITFLSKDLIFMTNSEKLEMIRLLGDSGTLFENEKRVAFGLSPIAELDGVRLQSLNYVNVEYAREYQTKVKQKIPSDSLDNKPKEDSEVNKNDGNDQT